MAADGSVFPEKRTVILHLSRAGSIGGVSRVVQALAAEQERLGFEVHVGFPPESDEAKYRTWFGDHGKLHFAPFFDSRAKPLLKHFIEACRWMRRLKPAVVHIHCGSHMINPYFPFAAWTSGCKRIATVHNVVPERGLSTKDRWLTLCGQLFCKRVIATSERMKDGLRSVGVPSGKLATITLPVAEPQGRSSVSMSEVREHFGLPHQAFLIGNVARFASYKGQINLIKAVQLIATTYPDIHLALLGYGEIFDEVSAYVDAYCRELVTLIRDDARLADFFRSIDLFAHVPSYEGFGMVYLEAALMSRPSIGSRIDGVPFAVLDGVTGRLVEYGDIEGTADAIQWMIDHPQERQAMGERAASRTREEFAPERVAQQYLQAYGVESRVTEPHVGPTQD